MGPQIEDAEELSQTASSNKLIIWRSFFDSSIYSTNTSWMPAMCCSRPWGGTSLWMCGVYRETEHRIGARPCRSCLSSSPSVSLLCSSTLEKLLNLEPPFPLWDNNSIKCIALLWVHVCKILSKYVKLLMLCWKCSWNTEVSQVGVWVYR